MKTLVKPPLQILRPEEFELVEFMDGAVMFTREPFLPTLHEHNKITYKTL